MPQNSSLFEPLSLGGLTLPNRILMAPLTRSRSIEDGHLQTPLHAEYYGQRAGAGLIVSEATQISSEGQGYAWTPGTYTDDQARSWRQVTDAVHAKGGRIFAQLWHVGAISHPVFHDGAAPVSSSAWTPKGQAFVGDLHPEGPTVPYVAARALETDEIPRLLDDYRNAARAALDARFDGVELHAANGYLIDQFLRSSVNTRDDLYGGSVENRVRLLTEALSALLDVLPAEKVGVRLSPTGGPGGSSDADPHETYTAAARALACHGLAYLHVIRPNTHQGNVGDTKDVERIMTGMRDAFDGVFVANGGFTPGEAAAWVAEGRADAIAFGRLFLANPDLPERIAQDGPYNEADKSTFYGGGAKGYTDYPGLTAEEKAAA
ncbi:alkene reductase [Rhodobacterales bacterium HKCCE2091]|nr:alkene reductase [Rhodobacterales bacterium HKCCE2091]